MIKKYLKESIQIKTDDNIISLSNHLSDKSQQSLDQYFNSGRYNKEIKSITNHAIHYACEILSLKTKFHAQGEHQLAAIFDVDETILSNVELLANNNFVNSPDLWAHSNGISTLPAIDPVKELYELLLSYDITVFIITAREHSSIETTEKNLSHCGFHTYEKLYLLPDESDASLSDYKKAMRAEIINLGYRIVLNIGDKPTDFTGGLFDQGFLLPNYFY